jgi:hypothetical protein
LFRKNDLPTPNSTRPPRAIFLSIQYSEDRLNSSDCTEPFFQPYRWDKALVQFQVRADANQRKFMRQVEPDHLDKIVAWFFASPVQYHSGR